MKINKPRPVLPGAIATVLLLCGLFGNVSGASADLSSVGTSPGRPRISSVQIELTEVVVEVSVPAGVKKITLESRTRLGAGAWLPRAVQRVDGSVTSLTFRLPKSETLEVIRVRGDADEPLPASFYAGTTNFNGQASSSPGSAVFGPPESAPGPADGRAGDVATRDVVESDIWEVRGDTLYFFNQYRGLQIIDLHDPDSPFIRGTLDLPASGEKMYLLSDEYALLLASNGCGWQGDYASRAIVVALGGAAPSIVASVAVPGYLQESRLVGTALYVASQSYRKSLIPPKVPDDPAIEQWEWGTVVSSFDFSNPTAPVAHESLWFAGYGNVISATDKFLFVGTQDPVNWQLTAIQVVDISSPDGAMKALSRIQPAGRVTDKFKMNLAGDVFTTISEVWNMTQSSRMSVLETWSLADPGAPSRLGRLEVGHGEGLYATRFDGDRAYIVTFLRIDPLWVVDLKDPAQPKLSGELQVPGWSTYIHPMGDRLLTVGIDNTNSWKVAISLFDVKDATKPALLAKVPLGENSSWSEASFDEKAFTVLPEANLVLLPYQGWADQQYSSRVQLIDLGENTLVARGVIEHQIPARRATLFKERVLSISGRELIVVNAADRDRPAVSADLELSWSVERVLLAGDYLIEVSNNYQSTGDSSPILRVAKTGDTGHTLGRFELGSGLQVSGATVLGERLYVLLGPSSGSFFVQVPEDGSPPLDPPNFVVSVLDVSHLPELKLLGTTSFKAGDNQGSSDFDPLWVKPGVLVWAARGNNWRWWGPIDFVGGARGASLLWWPWWGSSQGRLVAVDVGDASAPRLLSDLQIGKDQNSWNFSRSFAVDGKIHLSHQNSEFVEGVLLPGQTKPPPEVVVNPDGTKTTQEPVFGIWVTHYYLDVVDYADPAAPTVRPAVNLPGELKGVSSSGALLYSQGYHWDKDGTTQAGEYVDLSAYDGVQVSLIASMKLPDEWPRTVLIKGDAILLARSQDNGSTGVIETWVLAQQGPTAGKLELKGTLKLASAVTNLKIYGDLLAAQFNGNNNLQIYDSRDNAALVLIGAGVPSGCYWPNLENGDASVSQGLWLPSQDYGVFGVPVNVQP